MFNNERIGMPEDYKDNLDFLGGLKPPGSSSYWQKLSDYYGRMSADQQNFVSSNSRVLKSKTKMMEAFSLFIFERYKDEFIKLDGFRKLCDDYIDTVITTGQKYSERIAKTVDENESLKAKIAELERKLEEQNVSE